MDGYNAIVHGKKDLTRRHEKHRLFVSPVVIVVVVVVVGTASTDGVLEPREDQSK
jgi:hypothetical protein